MTKALLKPGLLFVFSFLIFQLSYSQSPASVSVDKVTDKQIEEYYKAALARGLSESQIEAAAIANGYTREDVAKIRERLTRLKTGVSVKNGDTLNVAKRKQLNEVSKRTNVQVAKDTSETGLRKKRDSLKDEQEEEEDDDELKERKEKPTFGSDLFSRTRLTFEPNLRIPTPPNYILGPDDELRIDISGFAYQHYSTKISPEGTIKIENLSPIYVNGLTITQAKEKITQRLKSIFGGLSNGSLSLDLTLGDVRSIKITVVGETAQPGTYTVSSLATVFHALYMSGGPSEIGSFRNIQLIRGNRIIQHVDLYEFLVKGTIQGNVQLHDQDIVLIPLADRKVEFDGEVKRPLLFELKPEETLTQLLSYAGGFTAQAFTANLKITRNNSKEKQLISLDAGQFDDFTLKNGDVINVGAILERFENKVEILGAVFRPGEFAISQQLKTLKQLIAKAEGLREDAFMNHSILIRKRENLDPEFVSVDLDKLMNGEIADIELRKEDILMVKSITEVREIRNVVITGAVIEPGEYDFVDNMTVGDLVLLAGGFKEGATNKRIEIARRVYNDESNDKTVEVLPVIISKDLQLAAGSIILSPFDHVFIRELPNYQEQKMVEITGEVNYPGKYAIENRSEKIHDLIKRAGGLRPEADIQGAKFFRDDKLVAVNLKEVFVNPKSINNLTLEDKDRLSIPKEQQTVLVSGQVLNPTSVAFQPDYSFSDYIAQAGGFNDSAYVRKTYVKYANGLTDRTRSIIGFKKYPAVQKGMEIVVPSKHREKLSKAEVISISTGLVSLSAVLLTLFRVL